MTLGGRAGLRGATPRGLRGRSPPGGRGGEAPRRYTPLNSGCALLMCQLSRVAAIISRKPLVENAGMFVQKQETTCSLLRDL